MSAPRFRVGDVVRTASGAERIVRGMDGAVVRVAVGMSSMLCHPAELTLLRRPVQVGDVLRDANGVEPDFHVVRVDRDLALDADCNALSLHMRPYLDRWTHEDGTPIEPPQPVADVPSGKDCPECGGGLNQFGHVRHCSLAPWSRREPPKQADAFMQRAEASVRPALPDVDTLARALFATDPEVIAFVEQVADAHVRKHATRWNAVTMRADTVHDIADDAPERRDAAMQRAWDRDEHGWATRATARAEAVLSKLGGAK